MDQLFNPRSIAVVGASRDATKWGGRVIKYLLKHGFKGQILPVNPGAQEVQGIECFPGIGDLPSRVDLAVVALPSGDVPQAVGELGDNGAAVAVVLASGFAELGPHGREAQEELVAASRATGVRVCGPNSVGVANIPASMTAAATSALDIDGFVAGHISVVSQSGAVGLGSVLSRAADRGIGLSKLVSMGNECELSSAEVIRYLAGDPETTAIGLFVEGVRDGRALAEAVEEAGAASKPVALLKVGRSREGVIAAATHTGQLAGAPEVFRGAMDAAGALWCSDLEDLLDKTTIPPQALPGIATPRIAVMSTSGGINTLAADAIGTTGLEMARLTDASRKRLAEQLPSFNPIGNPLDISGHVATRMDVQYACLKALLEDPNVDVVIVVLTVIPTYPQLVDILAERPLPSGNLVVFVNTGGSIAADASRLLQERHGYPVFESLSACATAIHDMSVFRRPDRAKLGNVRDGTCPPAIPRTWLRKLRVSPPGPVADEVLLPLLEAMGLRCASWAIVANEAAAVRAAGRIGHPVVLKPLTRTIRHKSDLDAVELDLRTDEAVISAYARIQTALATTGHTDCPLILQKHIGGAMEVLIGGGVDEQFGPVVTVGHGGIFANFLSRSVTRPAPLARSHDARTMLEALPGHELLCGYRNLPPRDIEALIDAVVVTSHLIAELAENDVSFELDLNPLLLLAKGEGAVVADALLEKRA